MSAQDKKTIEMKEEIASYLTKKDYYDILGLSKTADDLSIKKAYKKLALRFHPDKNQLHGAQEVFSKVSNAYSTLMDPEKRSAYDRYGPQQQRATQYRTRYNQRYATPEDLFEAMFRGQFNNPHFQHYSFNMGGPRRKPNNQNQSGGGFPLYYLLIFIFILYVLPALIGNKKPFHSFQKSSLYRYKMKTSILQTPFFVRQQFFSEASDNADFKRNIEETVDSEFLIKLKKECDQAIYQRKRLQYQASQYSRGTYRSQLEARAQNIDLSFCSIQRQLYQKHPEYIQNLFSY